MHFLFYECCGIVLKILEDFCSSAMDIKDSPVPEGKTEYGSCPEKSSNSWLKAWESEKRQLVRKKNTIHISSVTLHF